MVTGLALFLLPGCSLLSSGNYLDRKLACDANPHDWWGTLTRYVDQGNGEGGFNLTNMAEPYLDVVQGKYDLSTGDLGFSREYSEEHYFVQEIGKGYGIVDRNGDLDVIYKLDHEDVLGEGWTTEIHEVREGCYGKRTELYSDVEGDQSVVEYRLSTDDEVIIHYVSPNGNGTETTDGSDYSDGTGTRVRVYEGDSYAYVWDTTLTAAGGYSSAWVYQDFERAYDYDGLDIGRFDGSRIRDYAILDADTGEELAVFHDERAYDGSGDGQITYAGGTTCDYDYRNWNSCSCECSNGATCSC